MKIETAYAFMAVNRTKRFELDKTYSIQNKIKPNMIFNSILKILNEQNLNTMYSINYAREYFGHTSIQIC